ncbi:MAG: hypothetical protein NVSMB9_25350 [Isosphaeraceae bacterium]
MLLDVVDEELASTGDMSLLRVRLGDEGVGFYNAIAGHRPNNPDVGLELARTEERSASLHRMVGEFPRAETGYQAAVKILKDLGARYPRNPEYPDLLAHTESQFGELLRIVGRLHEAEPHYREAVRIASELRQAHPGEARYDSLECRNLNDLAHFVGTRGRLVEAEALSRRAVERGRAYDASLRAEPDQKESWKDRLILPLALSGHGGALLQIDRVDDAEKEIREASGILRGLLKTYPRKNDIGYMLADTLNDLGKILARKSARRAEALAAHNEAIELMTSIVKDFPNVTFYPTILATFHADRGATRTDAAQYEGAEDDLKKARAQFTRDAEEAKDSLVPLQALGRVTNSLARLEAKRGRIVEARTLFNEAIKIQQTALKLDPGSRVDKELLEGHQADLKALEGR